MRLAVALGLPAPSSTLALDNFGLALELELLPGLQRQL
jgi:hypothetical protein